MVWHVTKIGWYCSSLFVCLFVYCLMVHHHYLRCWCQDAVIAICASCFVHVVVVEPEFNFNSAFIRISQVKCENFAFSLPQNFNSLSLSVSNTGSLSTIYERWQVELTTLSLQESSRRFVVSHRNKLPAPCHRKEMNVQLVPATLLGESNIWNVMQTVSYWMLPMTINNLLCFVVRK